MSRTEKQEKMQLLVNQWQQSGLSPAEFARVNNIQLFKLRYWINKQQSNPGTESPFIQLDGFIPKGISLRYPNGVELTLPAQTPVNVLRSLIFI